MSADPEVVAFGLGVGVLVGLTGIGGGSLMTPLLILFVGVQPVVAIGTDLAYGAITKTVGGWRHLRQGTVDIGVSLWLAIGSVPGALVGVVLLDILSDRYGQAFEDGLLVVVAVALLLVGLTIVGRALFAPGAATRERESVHLDSRNRLTAVLTGFLVGVLVGGTSVGSGALIGLVLIIVFRLTPHRVVGTDVFHAAILLWVAGIAHWIGGNVDLVLMANILMGSLPGVVVGTALIGRVSAGVLRPALGCMLLAASVALLRKGGLDVPVSAIVWVPGLAAATYVIVHRRRASQDASNSCH